MYMNLLIQAIKKKKKRGKYFFSILKRIKSYLLLLVNHLYFIPLGKIFERENWKTVVSFIIRQLFFFFFLWYLRADKENVDCIY